MNLIRDFFIKKRIRKHFALRQSVKRTAPTLNEIKKIGVLIGGNELNIAFAQDLKNNIASTFAHSAVSVLFFQPRETQTKNTDIISFSNKDFSWNANLTNQNIKDFTLTEFDVLIHYFPTCQQELLWIGLSTKTKLSVGIGSESIRYNDIVINCSILEQNVFTQELKRVLQRIQKL